MNRLTYGPDSQRLIVWARVLGGLTLLLLCSMFANAQSVGTVIGTVTDQSGAVVPKANVTLHNEATGEERNYVSNDSGYFSFASVTPGSYTIKVSGASFKTWQRSGVVIRPGDVRDINDIKLAVGASSETIEVITGAGELAPVDSGERSDVLTSKQIENLSLEGRDATELIRTLPGFAVYNANAPVRNQAQDFTVVSPLGSSAVGQGYVGNGAPYRGGTDVISDGAHILDNGCNCGQTATINGDMVSEVKVQTSNFGADSSKGPVVVNAVGKSGTTSYHGAFVLHARDEALDSLDWAFKHQLLTSPKGLVPVPASRFLYPGAQLSGPVPHTNKKLVFFVGYEYYYQNGFPFGANINVPGLLTDLVPTMSMRNGDFTNTAPDNAAVCSPAAGSNSTSQFCSFLGSNFFFRNQNGTNGSGAVIPSSQFDPGGVALMNAIPKPNADPTKTGGFNYLQPELLDQNGFIFHPRVDYNISDNSKLYVTYQMQKETDQSPVHLWWTPPNSIPYPGGMTSKDNSETLSGHFVKIFNATLTNDFSMGLGYVLYPLHRNDPNAWGAQANGYPYKTVFGDPNSGKYGPTNSYMMPTISNGYWVTGVPFMDQQDLWENGGGNFTWKKANFSLEDDVTKSLKTHTIKAGFYWERTANYQGAFTPLSGQLSFQPFFSNNQNCVTNNSNPKSPLTIPCGSNNPAADILLGVAGNFTQVNRAALDSLWYPTYSGFVQDDWKVTRRLTLNLGLRADHLGSWTPYNSTGVATWTGNLGDVGPNPFAPGITWHGANSSIPLSGRTVNAITWQPRFGMALDLRGNGKTVLRGGWGEYGYRDQWNDYAVPVDFAQGVVTFNTNSPVRYSDVPNLTARLSSGSVTAVILHDHLQPVTQTYNFTISQQAPWNSLFEIGYVGSSTHNEVFRPNGDWNINYIPMGGLFKAFGCTAPCATSTSGTTALTAYNIGGTAAGSTTFQGNPLILVDHIAVANYNGLQASWARQTGRISYNLNYTWSKALGTQGAGGGAGSGLQVDSTGPQHNYGVLGTDRSHVVNLSYTFQTGNPVHSKGLSYVVNGWNLSGITTWQSGADLPEVATTNFNLTLNGNWTNPSNAGTLGSGSGISNTSWLGTNAINLQPTVTCDPTAHLHTHQYVNMSCFGVPGPGQQGRWQLPYIHAPAFFNSDLAIFKTFKVTERQNLEFRASAFNFLNHPLDSFLNTNDPSLTLPFNLVQNGSSYSFNSAVKAPAAGVSTLGNSQAYAGYASTRFGRRVMELSMKYSF